MASERTVINRVRPQVVDRDGTCRIGKNLLAGMGRCDGRSEWCHIGITQRWKTRKMSPEFRHTVMGTTMLCHRHHRDLDEHRLDIEELTPERADGRLAFIRDGRRFEED